MCSWSGLVTVGHRYSLSGTSSTGMDGSSDTCTSLFPANADQRAVRVLTSGSRRSRRGWPGTTSGFRRNKRWKSATGSSRAEQEARTKREGLWKDFQPVPPWEYRSQRAGLRIRDEG